ncbi:MAG: class I SAM-dependent methyltransferase [Pseudomonadota bacterium]|nr:class I SAM-dependent methyltransferase [Pseudomonadota bacterium]
MTDHSNAGTHSPAAHTGLRVSDWVRRWSHLVPTQGTVLDLACGSGRHTRWFHERGCAVTAVDRDAIALRGLQEVARTVLADLEGQPWPLPGERFGAVVVTHYLWRPLLPDVARSVAESGVLIYETFAAGNASVGKPSNPDFLLRPGELLQFSSEHGLRVVAYEDGFARHPDRYIQRLVAIREPATGADLCRLSLEDI